MRYQKVILLTFMHKFITGKPLVFTYNAISDVYDVLALVYPNTSYG